MIEAVGLLPSIYNGPLYMYLSACKRSLVKLPEEVKHLGYGLC